MIVEQPEAFKVWLTAVLKPRCEADPETLAKYVLALIKKDKTEEELRKVMVDQLQVFLENETQPFVELVLQTLDNQNYIITGPVIPNTNPPNPIVVKTVTAIPTLPPLAISPVSNPPTKELKPIVHPNDLPSLTEQINGSKKEKDTLLAVIAEPKIVHRKSDEKEEKSRLRPRNNRSRSRSWERAKRSKSRERGAEPHGRDKRDRRAWRNKSPPRRFDRRRSRTPTPPRGRSRSRSPPKHRTGGRYRNRTPPRSDSRSRSRSRSPRIKDTKEPHSRPATPTQDSNHGDMDMRLNNTTQSIQSVVVQQGAPPLRRCRDFDEYGYCMSGEMCPYDHGADPVVVEDTALSSVLAYTNPNIVPGEGPNLGPHFLSHPQNIGGAGGGGGGPRRVPPEYNPAAPQMWNRPGYRGPRPPGMPRGPNMGFQGMQRELIPVPVMDNKHQSGPPQNHHHHQMVPPFGGGFRPQGYQGGNNGGPHNHPHHHHNRGGEPQFKRKAFDFARLGPRSKNPINCSLELKKVPPGLNTITHLNNHFSKFGKTVNIQVNYEGDSEAAIVTFSSHAEANAAYRSTEAVLNNRFIKVFWHNNNNNNNNNNNSNAAGENAAGKQENVPPSSSRSVKDRLGVVSPMVPPNTNKVLNLVQPKIEEGDEEVKIAALKDENKAQATAAIKKNQELLAAKEKFKKNQDEQRKEVFIMKNNLRKRKQELLTKQLKEQKSLIAKMEKMPAGAQRDAIMETIKKTQNSIETIEKELQQTPPIAKKTINKEDVQKEMLDAELDLITKQQEGADTSEIQKRILELRAKAARTTRGGMGGVPRGARGGARFNPLSRHLLSKNNLVEQGLKGAVKTVNKAVASFQKHTVDHRPTRLLVSGYEGDEQEGVLKHFQSFGEIVDFVVDSALPSITLNYKTRKEAEMALLKGKHFQDRTLSITWCTLTTPSSNSQTANPTPPSRKNSVNQLQETDEDRLIEANLAEGEDDQFGGPEISEEALLQDDEEEDDESEDRSWRR